MSAINEPGSIQASLEYLRPQEWWCAFRAGRRDERLLDDVLWVGHFCRWLQQQRLDVEACTPTVLNAYLATLSSFRAGPRAACERTVTALIAFLRKAPNPADRDQI